MLFVHLSDIHFKKDEVEFEDDPNAGLRNDIFEDVRRMRESIGRDADAVLISGDVAFAGLSEEYDFAYRWLEEKLCPAAGCQMDDVFVIPGNHDVNRKQGENPIHENVRANLRAAKPEKIDEMLRKLLHHPPSAQLMFAPLDNYNKFAANFLCAIGPHDQNHPEIKPYVKRSWPLNDGTTLTFWGFSSVLVSDNGDDERLMFVDPMGKQIQREDNVTHAVMCHHPYNWLRNGADFQTRLEEVTCLQLFGHEHTRRVQPGVHFTTVRAGAVHPERDSINWDPGYNWIDLSVDTKADGSRALDVKIWVRKWENHRFIAVPDRKGHDPWVVSHDLPKRRAAPLAQTKTVASNMAQAPDSPPEEVPKEPIQPHTVARKLLSLAEPEQRQIIVELHLDETGDQGLKDYQFVLAAIKRAIDRAQLAELNEKTVEMINRKAV